MLNQSDYSDEFWYRAKHKEIRWSRWVATRYIHIYEAVLLSLDLDPERIYYPERRWAHELNSRDRLSLDERVEIIEGYMGSGKPFDTDETFLNYKVDLRYFSQVLTDNFLPIPEILKKYVIDPSDLLTAIKAEREEYFVDQDYLSKKAGVISGESVLTTKELIRRELEDNRKKDYKETKYQYADEIKQLKNELAQAKERIKQLEAEQKSYQSNLLGLIFDETALERYAPDLALSIKLWIHLYIDTTQSTDSHSNRANNWIKSNTPYENETAIDAKRLREVTSPFKGWNINRRNKFNNK